MHPPPVRGLHWDNRNVSLSFAYSGGARSSSTAGTSSAGTGGAGGGGAPPGDALLRAYAAMSAAIVTPAGGPLRLKLVPGDVLLFDNKRCLHGREAYDPRTGGRWLQGCYVDGDMLASAARALAWKRRGELDGRYHAPGMLGMGVGGRQ